MAEAFNGDHDWRGYPVVTRVQPSGLEQVAGGIRNAGPVTKATRKAPEHQVVVPLPRNTSPRPAGNTGTGNASIVWETGQSKRPHLSLLFNSTDVEHPYTVYIA
jgi:hypothetical protein